MDVSSLPVIDLSCPDRPQLVESIRDACTRAGFFYVRNHGVSAEATRGAFRASRAFFERCPKEEKQRLAATKHPLWRGFLGEEEKADTCGDQDETADAAPDQGSEAKASSAGNAAADQEEPATKRPRTSVAEAIAAERERRAAPRKGEVKESFVIGAGEPGLSTAKSPMHGANNWPSCSSDDFDGERDFRGPLLEYWSSMLELSRRLSALLALSLNLPERYFLDAMRDPCAQMVLLRYPRNLANPAASEDTTSVGCGAHTDCGFLTILAQEEDAPASAKGLQVLSTASGWVAAPPVPGAFIVNLGDMLQFWTKGKYKSTRHRVIMDAAAGAEAGADAGKARYSIPFFCNCDYEAPLENLERLAEEKDAGNKEKGAGAEEITTAGVYIMEKLGLMRS